MLPTLFSFTHKKDNTMNAVVMQYYRQAKLAENQLLVAALRRDAGEIDNDELSLSAAQYASAVCNWRLARETQFDEITERN
jgi:hypothetical protein